MLLKVVVCLGVTVFAAGCATNPENIAAMYVSPDNYKHYSCEQIMREKNRVLLQVNQLSAAQKKEAEEDAVATGAGMILFWPALLFLADGGGNEAQIAALKGQHDALDTAFLEKDC